MPTAKGIHARVAALLAKGHRVYSHIFGMIGEVEHSSPSGGVGSVIIKPRKAGKRGKTRYAGSFSGRHVIKRLREGEYEVTYSAKDWRRLG